MNKYNPHSKVQSGVVFPNYINEIKQPGSCFCAIFVTDDDPTCFWCFYKYKDSTSAKYEPLTIAVTVSAEDMYKR